MMADESPYAAPKAECQPDGMPGASSRELRELRAHHDDSRRIAGLGRLWLWAACVPFTSMIFPILGLLDQGSFGPYRNPHLLSDLGEVVTASCARLPVPYLLLCLGGCLICMTRPAWAARPFFVFGGVIFRSTWPKFRTLFGADRIPHARIKAAYDEQERQIGRLSENDLERLRFRPGEGWNWEAGTKSGRQS